MIPFFALNQILIVLINVLAILIGVLVYKHNPKGKTNRTLALMAFFMLLWVDFAYIPRLIGKDNSDLALSLLKVAWFVTPLFFTSLYFLVIYLLEKEKKYRILNKFVLFFGLLAAFLTGFTDFVVASIRFVGSSMAINYGSAMLPFLGIISFLIIATLYPLFKEYFKSPPSLKLKLQYFLIGIFIFYLANIVFNIALPLLFDIVRFYWIGDYSTLFLLGFIGYAIIAKQLFGIKIILTQTLIGVIAILLLIQTATADGWFEFSWKFALLFLFLIFGYLLIRSVQLEIKRREELENLTSQLEVANVKLTSAYKKLEILDKAKSEFISIASHQLRTPLTAIKGYISMILEKTYDQLPEKIEKPLENIYVSNERLIKLVNDLLSVSRIEAGKIELELEGTSIEEIISGVIEELRMAAEKKNIYLRLEKVEKPLPKILADKDKIRQVIMNIIDNAIRYTKKGGITIKINPPTGGQISPKQSLRDAPGQANIKIIVADTGQGMTKKEISKLFESFSRGKAGTIFWTEGAGLGLYIAKKFIEMHKGKIWVESKGKDKGSTFYIELPSRSEGGEEGIFSDLPIK